MSVSEHEFNPQRHVSLQEYTRIMRGEESLPHLPGSCEERSWLFVKQKEVLTLLGVEIPVNNDQLLLGSYEMACKVSPKMDVRNLTQVQELVSKIIARANRIQRELWLALHKEEVAA